LYKIYRIVTEIKNILDCNIIISYVSRYPNNDYLVFKTLDKTVNPLNKEYPLISLNSEQGY